MSITMLFGGAALLLALIGYRDPNESNEEDKSGDTGEEKKNIFYNVIMFGKK